MILIVNIFLLNFIMFCSSSTFFFFIYVSLASLRFKLQFVYIAEAVACVSLLNDLAGVLGLCSNVIEPVHIDVVALHTDRDPLQALKLSM